jgi:FkbH-like protein
MSADKIKCIVWDLDNTLWQGILLEDSEVTLVTTIVDVIKTLDARGILHSIASRNDHAAAEKKLRELGLWDYFIYPAISWCDKSSAIERIARQINIGINTLAFVDDQPFELDEVRSRHPEVAFFTPEAVPTFLHRAEFMPRFITVESALRRQYFHCLSGIAGTGTYHQQSHHRRP